MNLANFTLAKTSLIRLGCPIELEGLLANKALGRPIVAVANKKELGKTSFNYCPAAVVVCGGETRRQLLAQGHTKSWAWVENGAVQIDAEESIGTAELMTRLSQQLTGKFYGSTGPLPGQAFPSIAQIYPFENYLLFNMKGNNYRQQYALDPTERNPRMIGDAQLVRSIKAGEDTTTYSPESKQFMPKSQTGAHYVPGWTPGNSQSTTQGGRSSELVTSLVRNLSDIHRAVAQYLAVIHGGRNIRPDFQPVAMTLDHKINAMLEAKGVDAFEFALWVASTKMGKRGGTKISKSKFAYAPGNEPSKWKLPVDTPGRAKNALARVNQTQGIPADKKAGVLNKIRRAAKSKGAEVSEKPTPGQKKWAASVEYKDYMRAGKCPGCKKDIGDLNVCKNCGKKAKKED